MDLDVSTIFAGIVFGAIGFSAFLYGKKIAAWKPMVIGIVLMGYSYFVPGAIWQWVIGILLTAALFLWR